MDTRNVQFFQVCDSDCNPVRAVGDGLQGLWVYAPTATAARADSITDYQPQDHFRC
jgi:hypothetical protein